MPFYIVLLLGGVLGSLLVCIFVSRKIPYDLMQGTEVTLQIVQWHGGSFPALAPSNLGSEGEIGDCLVFWQVLRNFKMF